jgi:conjugal transfer/entry exclusion protein
MSNPDDFDLFPPTTDTPSTTSTSTPDTYTTLVNLESRLHTLHFDATSLLKQAREAEALNDDTLDILEKTDAKLKELMELLYDIQNELEDVQSVLRKKRDREEDKKMEEQMMREGDEELTRDFHVSFARSIKDICEGGQLDGRL